MVISNIPRARIADRYVSGWNSHGNNVLLVPSESRGERIRRLRLASKRSMRQFAKDAGIGRNVVNDAEHNRMIALTSFVEIARALRVSLDSLWFGEGRVG